MRNNCVNKGIFHFLDARSWAPMPVWYENRSGYITGNMCNLFHAAIIIPFLTTKFPSKT